MSSLLIESARILVGEQLTPAYILLEDDRIKSISKRRPTSTPDSKIDAKGLIALPGLIDVHVHLRDLEFSYKETFETGTRAAAAGGYTTVFDMPNSRPPTVTAINLAEKMAKAKGGLYSNVGFQGALVEDGDEVRRMAKQGAIAFKIYLNKSLVTFNSSDQTALTNALQAAKQVKAIVTVHAEDGDRIRKSQQESVSLGKLSVTDFLRAHTPAIEVTAVRKILGLGSKLGSRLHICHITVPEAVELVRMTPNATCEASAHHLLLNRTVFRKQRTLAICVPPIRSEANRSRLWRLFAKGRVNILASDHAPHTLEEKTKQNAWEAASGVPGLETSLPMLFTQVSNGKLSLQRLVEATATLPAKLFHLPRKGKLEEGYDADIVLVDPKAKSRISPKTFLSKAKYSPFKGLRCVGSAAYTIVNGILVAERGTIVGSPTGRVIQSEMACSSS
jgi:dihydroorotase (multifunctional complex type)